MDTNANRYEVIYCLPSDHVDVPMLLSPTSTRRLQPCEGLVISDALQYLKRYKYLFIDSLHNSVY